MSKYLFDTAAWNKLDLFNQLGNIGSEVGRALAAKRKGQDARMEAAFLRGMDLCNATVDDWAAKGNRSLKELLIAREQFAESILTDTIDQTLEKYFMDFAMAARSKR